METRAVSISRRLLRLVAGVALAACLIAPWPSAAEPVPAPAARPRRAFDSVTVVQSQYNDTLGHNIPDLRVTLDGQVYDVGFLQHYRNTGGLERWGYPTSEVFEESEASLVQYYQRGVVDWHRRPDLGGTYVLERRLTWDYFGGGAGGSPDLGTEPGRTNPHPGESLGPWGHRVSNTSIEGVPIGFLEYFNRLGGVDSFGFPKSDARYDTNAPGTLFISGGSTVSTAGFIRQYFQAAVFEYHPVEGLVMLRLLGDDLRNASYRNNAWMPLPVFNRAPQVAEGTTLAPPRVAVPDPVLASPTPVPASGVLASPTPVSAAAAAASPTAVEPTPAQTPAASSPTAVVGSPTPVAGSTTSVAAPESAAATGPPPPVTASAMAGPGSPTPLTNSPTTGQGSGGARTGVSPTSTSTRPVPACTTETEAQRQPCYGEILSILGAFSSGSPVEHPTERLAALTGLPQSVVREVLLRPGSSQERLGWLADLLNVRRLRPQEFDARKEVIEATQRLRDVSLDAARKTQAVEAATNPTQKAQAVQALAAAVQQTQTATADLERKTQTLGALLQASQRPQVATMSGDVAQKAQAASVAAGAVRDLQGVAIAGDAARQRQLVGAAEDVVRQTQAMDSAATAMALGQIR